MSTSAKAFITVFYLPRGIFSEGCQITWESFRKTLLVEVLEAASKLEELAISQIKSEVLTEVAKVVEGA